MKQLLPFKTKICKVSFTITFRRRIFLTFLSLLFQVYSASAQNTIWDKTIGGNSDDQLSIIQQTRDGGYILGGTSSSGISGNKSQASKGSSDYWIVKLKADGAKEWDITIGGTGNDELTTLQQTSDGGYILGGSSSSGINGDKTEANKGLIDEYGFSTYDFWIIKLEADGTKVWDKTLGGNGDDVLSSLQQTSDGGFILGGKSNSEISGDKSQNCYTNEYDYKSLDYWIVKLNANGSKVWDKTIGGHEDDYLGSIQQTHDGGYILGGHSSSNIGGDKSEDRKGGNDYWIVKLKSDGTKAWDKTIGGSDSEHLASVQQTKDGGYILGGTSNSGISGDKSEARYDRCDGNIGCPYDYWVVKLKADGSKEWDKIFGDENDEVLQSIQQTSDGGYLLGGSSGYNTSFYETEIDLESSDYWVVKLQADGLKVWEKTFVGLSNDDLQVVWQTSDGGYIIGGTSSSEISKDKSEASKGEKDYWIVKLNNKIQGVVLSLISDKQFGTPPFVVSAQASSRLPVTFSIVSGPATLQGNMISLTGLGTVTIKASQAGNANYTPATTTQSFDVVPFKEDWVKYLGGNKADYLVTMIPTTDGGHLMGGSSQSGVTGDKSQVSRGNYDYWIVKTDKTGKKIWDRTFGGKEDDNLTTLLATSDGGYLLGGQSLSGISGDKSQTSKGSGDYWIIKIDRNGNKVWERTLGGERKGFTFCHGRLQ